MKGVNLLRKKGVVAKEQGLNILLVGNNPIEMSSIYDGLNKMKDKIFKVETAFSTEDTLQKISSNHPNCILIDDNLGLRPLKILIKKINELGKEAIAITLLKTQNQQELTTGVQEYVMKNNLSSERVYIALKNAIKFKKTQQFLKIKYYTGKKRVKRMFI